MKKEKDMSNAPALKAVSDVSTEVKSWGAADDLESNDLAIPRIFHQQGQSKLALDGKARAGDWCDSVTGEILAKREDPLYLVIFSSFKRLLISEAPKDSKGKIGKFELKEIQEVTPENIILPWTEEVAGGVLSRKLQYSYYCLVTSKMTDIPYVVSLSSTKIKAAKKLNTMFQKLKQINLPSAAFVFEFKSEEQSNDDGTWFNVDITQGGKTSPEEQEIAYDWYQKIKSSNVIISEEEDGASA